MNPESAGVPGVMLRLKRRIASYMYKLQILCFGYSPQKRFYPPCFFSRNAGPRPGMRHRMDEDKVQH